MQDVRFTYDDDYVVSAGGSDMSVFQWRHVIPNKIYVQNLPDAKNEDGSYKIGYWEMRAILEDYFGKMLKIDHDVVRSTMGVEHEGTGKVAKAMHSGDDKAGKAKGNGASVSN